MSNNKLKFFQGRKIIEKQVVVAAVFSFIHSIFPEIKKTNKH